MDQAPIQAVDIAQSLDTTLTMFASRLEHVTIDRRYDPALPHISAYGSELNQVWTELIANALDAMSKESTAVGNSNSSVGTSSSGIGASSAAAGNSGPDDTPRGTLRLKTSPLGEMVTVEVWNDGPGIPAEIVTRIFEPFYTTKPPGQGLGLGLDSVNRIVTKHNGIVTVESKPGATCFQVRLPIERAQAY
jgi:signal transduction histidine kinase